MRKRSADLLLYFLQINRTFSVNEITKRYQISPRTLKSDIDEINYFLSSINQSIFYIDEFGYIKNDNLSDYINIKNKLYSLNNYSYRCNQIERQLLIFAKLINQQNYITMEFLAEKLYVSRLTILSDIELMKENLENYSDIFLVSKSSKGIKLSSNSEINLRRYFIDLLRNIVIKVDDENVFLKIVEKELKISIPLELLTSVLKKFETINDIYLSDESFYELTLYLYVSFYRSLQNKFLKKSKSYNTRNKNIFKEILRYQLSKIKININPREQTAIINGIEYNNIYINSKKIDDIELYKIVVFFLSKIANQFEVKLEEDHLLVDSLVMHIKNMFDNNDFIIDFSGEKDFQERYWEILNDIDNNIIIIEKYLKRTFSEKVKLSIFVHVCAALIRNQKYKTSLRVLIVCPGSMATGRFVEAQLNDYFNFKRTEVVAADRIINIMNNKNSHIDLIVSTVDIGSDIYPIIIVEPILTNSDFNKIQNLITKICDKKRQSNEINSYSISKSVMDIFDKLDKNQKDNFIFDLKKITNHYNQKIKRNANSTISMMLKDSQNIKILNEKINWIDAINLAGNILLIQDCINEEYINEMIDNIKQFGPYIKVGEKIAIAHAKPGGNVYAEGFSLLLSSEGIFFDEYNEPPINLMFCFSTKGELEYIDLFWQITHLANDKKLISSLINSKTAGEAYQLIYNSEL